jgi:hypothetical protein
LDLADGCSHSILTEDCRREPATRDRFPFSRSFQANADEGMGTVAEEYRLQCEKNSCHCFLNLWLGRWRARCEYVAGSTGNGALDHIGVRCVDFSRTAQYSTILRVHTVYIKYVQ